MSEAVTLKPNGTFSSGAGGSVNKQKNRYEAVDLIGSRHKKVVIRFDPQKLHENVLVYSLDGRFLAEAVCTKKAGFGDTVKAREQKRDQTRLVKSTKAAAKAQMAMTQRELAALHEVREVEDEALPPLPSITEIMVAEGNTMRKQEVETDADTENEFDNDFMRAMALLKKGNK